VSLNSRLESNKEEEEESRLAQELTLDTVDLADRAGLFVSLNSRLTGLLGPISRVTKRKEEGSSWARSAQRASERQRERRVERVTGSVTCPEKAC